MNTRCTLLVQPYRSLSTLPRLTAPAAVVLCLLAVPAYAQPPAGQQSPPDEGLPPRHMLLGPQYPKVWQMRRGGYLGVHLLDLTPELRVHFGVDESSGVMVASVADDSPAARAGLQVGDIVTEIDGEPVADRFDLARRIGRHEQGETVSIEVFRDGAFSRLDATVDERSRPQLWLSSTSEDGNYTMEFRTEDQGEWQTDEGVLVFPSGEGSTVEIRGERLEQVMGRLHERLASPDFKAQMIEFNSNTAQLEKRIKELEEKLLELSKQLKELED